MMSIIWSSSDGWILCHSAYLHELYKNLDEESICTHCGKYDVFHIHSPFRDQKYQNERLTPTNTNANNKMSAETDEVVRLNMIFDKLMYEVRQNGINYFEKGCCRISSETENVTAVAAANYILNHASNSNPAEFNGGNSNKYSMCVSFRESDYFIPPLCRFFCCPVQDFQEKLRGSCNSSKFDAILLDPPWWNKHVRRKNAKTPEAGYKMIFNEQLSKVPIDSLLSNMGLVIVWCTNSQQHIQYLLNEIFPIWNVEYVCSWYWIKVVEDGRSICPFMLEAGKKRPFERIIFGARKNRSNELKMPEPDKLIVSIPSAVHSHKPPLVDVLSEYIPSDSRCLEIFARYLLPDWTSTGDEVLKLQEKKIFVNQKKSNPGT